MEVLEMTGKTVEEAIEAALNELGLSRADVEVEVLQEGKSGLLGFGGEEARVRVTPLSISPSGDNDDNELSEGPSDLTARAGEVVEKLLSLMEIEANVQAMETDDTPAINIDISNGDLGILIGRRGQSISALQHIVNSILSRELASKVRVSIDVAGYKKRRSEELKNLASHAAELVKSSGRSITLEPMPAVERRVVHLALVNDPEVATKSMGFGDRRKVVIHPQK
ncbi:MAG: RNA-binding cell elongation regulator Jag/EloR [Dehalococcoidia bacterium]